MFLIKELRKFFVTKPEPVAAYQDLNPDHLVEALPVAVPKSSILLLGGILERLEEEILKPAGYELYDFGGGTTVAPAPDLQGEGWLTTHLVAIIKFNGYDKNCPFSTFALDLKKFNSEDLACKFKEAIAEGREKYPELA